MSSLKFSFGLTQNCEKQFRPLITRGKYVVKGKAMINPILNG